MVNGLKEFWEKEFFDDNRPLEMTWQNAVNCIKEDLGDYFWERGGKRFVQELDEDDVDVLEDVASFSDDEGICAQDFLDCLACWGKEQLETKIKELGK